MYLHESKHIDCHCGIFPKEKVIGVGYYWETQTRNLSIGFCDDLLRISIINNDQKETIIYFFSVYEMHIQFYSKVTHRPVLFSFLIPF